MNELSAHGDQRDLLRWVKPLARTLRRIFLVHGEPGPAQVLAGALREMYDVEVTIPSRGDRFELS